MCGNGIIYMSPGGIIMRSFLRFLAPGSFRYRPDAGSSLRNWEIGFRLPKSEGIAGMIFYLLIRELPAIKADCQPERAGMRKQSSFSPAVYGTNFTGGCLGRISSYS